MPTSSKKKVFGFTMIQLLLSVGVLFILSAMVFIWLDPLTKIGQAEDERRRHDVLLIADAIADYTADHQGVLPVLGAVTTDKKVLCSEQSGSNLTCDSDNQLCLLVADDFYKSYLHDLPIDPNKSTTADSGYYLTKDSNNNLIVGACSTYGAETISKRPLIKANCSAYGGGYCWYLAGSANIDCDQVCAALGMTCVNRAKSGSDVDSSGSPFCLLDKTLTGDCSGSCSQITASGTPPYVSDDYTDCYIQNGSVLCSQAPGAAKYAVCPCQ